MISLVKIMLLFFLLPVNIDTAEEGGLVFDSTEWDFGKINVKDGPVNHIFHFKNTGDKTVTIGGIKESCVCVQANIPEKTIEAGGDGVIQFVFNPRRTRGHTYRTIEVFDEEGKPLVTLSITAECFNGAN